MEKIWYAWRFPDGSYLGYGFRKVTDINDALLDHDKSYFLNERDISGLVGNLVTLKATYVEVQNNSDIIAEFLEDHPQFSSISFNGTLKQLTVSLTDSSVLLTERDFTGLTRQALEILRGRLIVTDF